MENRKRIIFDDNTEGIDYVAVYHTGYTENDDSFEDTDTFEIVFKADSFDIATRYAQQYLRKMQTEEETDTEWASAEIISLAEY